MQFSHPFFVSDARFTPDFVYVVKHIATVPHAKVTPTMTSPAHRHKDKHGIDSTLAKNHPAASAA